MKKVVDSSKTTRVELNLPGESWCDFCGENEVRVARSFEQVVTLKDGTEIETNCADICYNCASQVASMLMESAEVSEDGQMAL